MIMEAAKFLGTQGVLLMDRLAMIRPTRPDENRILALRLDGIGDFFLWLDSVRGLRELYPKDRYEVVLLGNAAWSDLAEQTGYFDAVWPVQPRKFIHDPVYRWKTIQRIRRHGFSKVLNPTFSRVFLSGDAIVRTSGAGHGIGWQADWNNIKPWQKKIGDRWYTQLVPMSRTASMEIERNAEYMRAIGLKSFRAGLPRMPVRIHPPEWIRGLDYYVLFAGASADKKKWPLERFYDLAGFIHQRTNWPGILCGGEGDIGSGDPDPIRAGVPLLDRRGRTSLLELAGVIAGARLYLGNDTGALHMAAAFGVPSVCILGGGHYGRFLPYSIDGVAEGAFPVTVSSQMDCFGCGWRCRYKISGGRPAPCVEKVSVRAVEEEVIRLIPLKKSRNIRLIR